MAQSPAPKKFLTSYRTIRSGDLGWAISGAYKTQTNTVTGAKDPKWQEKIKSGADATLPYSRVCFPAKWKQDPIHWTWISTRVNNPPVTAEVVGNPLSLLMAPYSMGLPLDLAVSYSHAKLAFLGKIRDEQSPWMAGAFLGELKETIGMIRHPLKGILKETRKYRDLAVRSRFLFELRKFDRLSDVLEKGYLQWTYGVAPLLGDIESAKEAIDKLYKEPEIKRISASSPKLIVVEPVPADTTYWESGYAHALWGGWRKWVGKVRYIGALRVNLHGPTIVGAREAISMNLRDFVPTMYELIPYSFLVDYFSTTGDVVNGLFTNVSDLVYSCMSEKTTYTGTFYMVGLPSLTGGPVSWPLSVSSSENEGFRFNRQKASLSVGLRDLRLQLPSTDQWFKTAVLGVQRLRSAVDVPRF